MKKIDAIKDGKGNIVISENSFEGLLACLDNQKFVGEVPQNGDSLSVGKEEYESTQQGIQKFIDDYNKECRKILHQKYVFEAKEDGYFLTKRYEYQDKITSWTTEDVKFVYQLFKDTQIKWEQPENLKPITDDTLIMEGTEPLGINEKGFVVCKPESTPWRIERNVFTSEGNLTISEDGKKNRSWTKEEISKIQELFKKRDINNN